MKEWIEACNYWLQQKADSKLLEAGFDEYCHYYLQAQATQNGLDIIKVKGISLEKDLSNIKKLTEIIYEEGSNRSEGENAHSKGNTTWEEPSLRMKKAVTYLQMLVNDLDNNINQKKGEIYGYTYQGDGDKVKELENFISDNENQ